MRHLLRRKRHRLQFIWSHFPVTYNDYRQGPLLTSKLLVIVLSYVSYDQKGIRYLYSVNSVMYNLHFHNPCISVLQLHEYIVEKVIMIFLFFMLKASRHVNGPSDDKLLLSPIDSCKTIGITAVLPTSFNDKKVIQTLTIVMTQQGFRV